jgi:protein-S-isoprenylcysteine O-methyltransferase Ste14
MDAFAVTKQLPACPRRGIRGRRVLRRAARTATTSASIAIGIAYWPSGRSAKIRRFEFSVATRKRSEPYRWLRHPNYLLVALEFVFLPLLMRAFITLVVFSIVNLVLLRQRIRLEEMALAPDAAGRAMVGREA